MEEASPTNITWYYVGIFSSDLLVGIAVLQRVQLYLKDMFRNGASSAMKEFFKNILSRVLKGNVLVVGNLTHTGQHGIFIDTDKIKPLEFLKSLFEAIDRIIIQIKKEQGKNVRLVMCKDYFVDDPMLLHREFFELQHMHKVTVQPNMLMHVRSHWTNMDDYISDLNKKYRRRYKRARKKFSAIENRELDIEAIERNSDILYDLYKNVCDNARFNTFTLPSNHFYSLKLQLESQFRVFGYYLDNRIIGFYTLILNYGALETYFLGYDRKHQYANQLYLNMLYDMAGFAIQNKFETVVYARTAMEIKSSVGALPEGMVMYMKHTNRWANAILRIIFNFMNPSQKWKERHPFKT